MISLTALATVGFALVGTVQAIGEGQIAGGNFYTVRNVTKAGAYADTISADKCDTLKYSIRLHNPGPGVVNNVNVRVNLPTSVSTSNTSTATITSQNSDPASVNDTAKVNITSAQKINYIAGSSVLLDANGNVVQALSDQLVNGSGVNIGEVKVSLQQIRFVQFQAKLDCSTTPPCEQNSNLPQCQPCYQHPNNPECQPCKQHPNNPECKPTCKDNPNLPGCNPTCKDHPNMPECQPCKKNPNRPECQPCNQNPNMPECMPTCQDNQKDTEDCTPPTPPSNTETPGTPTGSEGVSELANTGPGQVAGLFSAAVGAGFLGYRFYLSRRFSQQ